MAEPQSGVVEQLRELLGDSFDTINPNGAFSLTLMAEPPE